MSDFLNLISALFAGYLVKAWPFMLVHILVAYLVSRSWQRLHHEWQALESWDVPSVVERDEPSSASSTETAETATPSLSISQVQTEKKPETIVVLERFVDESRVMGSKGLFVPMTDFSDRLDSAVEGKIAELHERTNLFLYVGIAGTMFGVFEFAHRSYMLIISNVAESDKLIKFGEYLSGSMSRAFPVGFFGLVLTFIAQILATRPEQRLREELSEATRKALEARKLATHSQGEIIQKASAEIAKAMAPLKHLETTLSESLKPVVEVFGERLDKSLGLIEKQFKRLETTSADLQKAVTDVKAAVGSIAEATQSLNSLIKETPKVMNRLAELEKKHERSLIKSDQLFDEHFRQADELSRALEKAIGNLSTLSDRVINEASEGIGRIEKASVGTWTAAAEELRKGVEAELEKVFEDANRQMTDIKATLTRALEVMTYVAEASKTSITELGELAPTVSANYKVSLDQVANHSSETWRSLSNQLFLDSQTQYLAYLDNVKRGTAESSEALKTAATEWYGLAVASKTVLREPVEAAVAEARNDLAERLRSLDGNVSTRITQFSGELTRLQSSTSGLVDNVRSINEDLRNWAAITGPMTKDLRSATESIKRQSETQVALVKRFEAVADKLTRVPSRPASPPRRPDDGPTIFTPLPRERRWWKPNTWFGGR